MTRRSVIFNKEFIFLIVGLSIFIQQSFQQQRQQRKCPCSNCPCYCNKKNRSNCANRNWTKVPLNFPRETTVINFQANRITKISARQFDGLNELTLLRFDNNEIETVEKKAFYGLPKLNQLVLKGNRIDYLPDDIIDPKAPLGEGLKLQNNDITSFPLNLLKRIRKSINLNNNSIDCNCFSVIPNDLKKLVKGRCSMKTSDGRRKRRYKISRLRYKDVNCGACSTKKCTFGSCFIDYGNLVKCRCFTGYSGDSCDQRDGAGNLTFAAPTEVSFPRTPPNIRTNPVINGAPSIATTPDVRSIPVNRTTSNIRATPGARRTPNTRTSLLLTTNLPPIIKRNSSKALFKFVTRPRVHSANNNTGDEMIIGGCRIKRPDTDTQFKTYYIFEDTAKIETPYTKVGKTMVQMENLEIPNPQVSDYGIYRCGVEFKDGIQLSPWSAYSTTKDISETRIFLKVTYKSIRRTASQIEQMAKDYIKSLNLPKKGIFTNASRGIARRGYYILKVIYTNLTRKEKLDYCSKIRSLDTLVDDRTGIFKAMDCCGYEIKKEDSEENPKGRGQLVFNPTLVGTMSIVKCKYGQQKIRRRCMLRTYGPTWQDINLDDCPASNKSSIKKVPTIREIKMIKTCTNPLVTVKGSIQSSLEDEKCMGNLVKVTTVLAAIERNQIQSVDDIEDTADIVSEIVGNINFNARNNDLKENQKTANTAIAIIDKMLILDRSKIAKSQLKSASSTKLVKALDHLTKKIAFSLNTTNRTYSNQQNNIAIKVELLNIKEIDNKINILGLSSSNDIPLINITKESSSETVSSKVTIPKSTLGDFSNPFVSVINYRDNLLFLSEREIESISRGINPTNQVPASNVLSASVGDQGRLNSEESLSNLDEPVTIAFRNTSNSAGTGTCMFWNFTCKEETGCWMTNGCWRVSSGHDGMIAMNCSHLTNFALIIDVHQEFNSSFELELVTYIGCGISILCLLLTIIIYLSMKNMTKLLAPKMLVCLSFSLLILLSLFVSVTKRTEPRIGCQIIAACIQYFMLATFVWIACEGINIYRNFIKLFKRTRNENVILIRMSVFAWGIPLVIVLCTVFLAPQELGNSSACLVTGNAFYFGVLAPVSVILATNWIVLVLSIRGMRTKKILLKGKGKQERWLAIWRALALAVVLGLTWTFGVLAVYYLKEVFQWAFCIFNSLQGFYIFIFFVVRNPDIRKALRKSIKRHPSGTTRYTQQTDEYKTSTLTTET